MFFSSLVYISQIAGNFDIELKELSCYVSNKKISKLPINKQHSWGLSQEFPLSRNNIIFQTNQRFQTSPS